MASMNIALRLTATLALIGAFPACAFKKKQPDTPAISAPQQLGTVRMVNSPEQFALIETPAPVAPGRILRSKNDISETATLRATPHRDHPFLIADIVEGTPSPGDRITIAPAATAGNSSNDPPER
jgi:hypothetical protein